MGSPYNNDAEPTLHRGLVGIHADATETTFIDGEKGILEYRGYNIDELADHGNFEEVAYLILYGELPNRAQLADFDKRLKEARSLPPEVIEIIKKVKRAHPMDVLRTAVSALAAFDPDRNDDSVEAAYRKGIRLTSQVAAIVLAHHNILNGREPVPARSDLSHAANFLYMMAGEAPSPTAAALMDKDFILHADHGLNASSFTARVITGTKADFHGAITASIAALSGPSHGGAAENVVAMIKEIGSPDKAEEYVKDQIANRRRIMGFGHRVYKTEDPRARHLEEGVKHLSEEVGESELYQILSNVRAAMAPYAKRGIHVNVDFYAGIIYHLLNIPQNLYVPIFAVGRVPGWTVQVVEQLQKNILIRPLLHYTGKRRRRYKPLEER